MVYFTITLPKENAAGKSIAFYTAHTAAEVVIDGEPVYSLYAGNSKVNKSTGYCWNFIDLTVEDAGKVMSVHMIPAYDDVDIMNEFDMITLPAFIPHSLKALENSIIRLSLSKSDSHTRVFKVANSKK